MVIITGEYQGALHCVATSFGTCIATAMAIVIRRVSFGTGKFDQPVALFSNDFSNDWTMRYFQEPPELKFHELPLEQTR